MPTSLLYSYASFVVAYLIGSLSFAVIVSRLMHLPDPRSYGSHNPGATNVLRSGSKVAAVLTLLLDGVKGYVPVAIAQWKAFDFGFEDITIAFVGVAVFVGHLWPVFFRFQGGKGVATALGVLLGFDVWLGLGVLATWIVVAAAFRYSSLAAIVAAVLAPFYQLMFYDSPSFALAVATMSLLLIWRHWRNIVRLASGRETRIGEKQPVRHHHRRHRHGHSQRGDAPPAVPTGSGRKESR
jgi:glycerol-3-phosphate acyltransferase PlsY